MFWTVCAGCRTSDKWRFAGNPAPDKKHTDDVLRSFWTAVLQPNHSIPWRSVDFLSSSETYLLTSLNFLGGQKPPSCVAYWFLNNATFIFYYNLHKMSIFFWNYFLFYSFGKNKALLLKNYVKHDNIL